MCNNYNLYFGILAMSTCIPLFQKLPQDLHEPDLHVVGQTIHRPYKWDRDRLETYTGYSKHILTKIEYPFKGYCNIG